MLTDCHIYQVDKYDVGNGPGIRTTVWVAGCSHHCEGCHNPQTWKWNQGKPLTVELIDKILKACEDPSCSGLSLSGGDPLFIKNRTGITELCKSFRTKFGSTKTIWMWTGYLYEEVKDFPVMQYVDVLVDGKFILDQKDISLPYSGSRNQKVIKLHANL